MRKKKKPIEKSRRIFKFETDEALASLYRFIGKKQVIRIIHKRKAAYKDYLQQSIFRLLFSKNAITSTGFFPVKLADGKRKYGMTSHILRGRSIDYKKYQNWWYVGRRKGEEMSAAVKRHLEFAEKTGIPFAEKVYAETGIKLNTDPVNICNVNQTPVFFEIITIDLDKVREYAKQKPKKHFVDYQAAQLEDLK